MGILYADVEVDVRRMLTSETGRDVYFGTYI